MERLLCGRGRNVNIGGLCWNSRKKPRVFMALARRRAEPKVNIK